jgi:predicted nucleotidyltransferase
MVSIERIQEFAGRIAREFEPERIVLFGSHARGETNEDSDVDLLVILPFEGKSCYKAAEIRSKVSPGFAVDLVVRTPEDVRRRLALGEFFMQDIIEEGRTLYESSHARVDP